MTRTPKVLWPVCMMSATVMVMLLWNVTKPALVYSGKSQVVPRFPWSVGALGTPHSLLDHPSLFLLHPCSCSPSCSSMTQTPLFKFPSKSLTQSTSEGDRCRCRWELELHLKHHGRAAGVPRPRSSSQHSGLPISSFEHAVQFRSPLPVEPEAFRFTFQD